MHLYQATILFISSIYQTIKTKHKVMTHTHTHTVLTAIISANLVQRVATYSFMLHLFLV